MKRFLYKLLLFVGIPLVICFTLNSFADKGLRKSCSFLYKEWNDIIDSKINADVLIMGSSRAWVHISPKVLDSAFNISSYNLGIDGYNFLMQYYRFKLYLKYNKKPAYIIQSLECQALAKRATLLNYQQFFPYLNEPFIREAISYYKGLDFKDVYFPLYKYRSDPDTLLLGIKSSFTLPVKCDNDKYKGFKSYNYVWDSEFEEFKTNNPNGIREKMDTMTVRLFENYLHYCKTEKINVLLVYPPEYYEAHKFILNRDSIINIYKVLSTKYDIPLIDYSTDRLCYNKKYFYNSQHLNSEGVNFFNKQLSKDLKHYIHKK